MAIAAILSSRRVVEAPCPPSGATLPCGAQVAKSVEATAVFLRDGRHLHGRGAVGCVGAMELTWVMVTSFEYGVIVNSLFRFVTEVMGNSRSARGRAPQRLAAQNGTPDQASGQGSRRR